MATHSSRRQVPIEISRIISVLFVLFLSIIPTAMATVTISVATSKTSGPAPLAVFFDANQTTASSSSTPFEDLEYSWTFGDTNSGDWNTTHNSRNTMKGPLAAHVYEVPGTYDVNISVRDANNDSSSQTITITVTNPDTFWADTNTVCFSTSGTFTGCPSGALNVQTLTYDNNYVANRR